jgi:salicylate hydroxylase
VVHEVAVVTNRVGRPKVIIVGAGLGGLAAALALAKRGFDVEVHEQARTLREVGAGLTLSRGAQRVLEDIGVLAAVRQQASVTRAMAFLHYRTGALLDGGYDHSDGSIDDGRGAGMHIHRSDLHTILTEAFVERRPGALVLGHQLVGVEDRGAKVSAVFGDRSSATGDLLVGADGLRSAVRTLLWGHDVPSFTGQVAYRCLVPGSIAAPFLERAGRAAVYFGPDRVFNRYSLRKGAIVNCVAIARTDTWREEGWTTPATRSELLALYDGWHQDVRGLMASAPSDGLAKWALYDREPLERWGLGRATLLGDAAHPMLPFLGLGAAMAIEDGVVLARALELEPDAGGLERYEAARLARTESVMLDARRERRLVQSGDPDRYDAAAAPSRNPVYYDFDPVNQAI